MPPAKQIAEKVLVDCPTFHFRTDLDKIVLGQKDPPFGVYFNDDESFENCVLFAPLGVYLPPNGEHYVMYKEIVEVTLPDKHVMVEDTKNRQLGLALPDGKTAHLPIYGERNRVYDIYDVERFLFKVRVFAKNW